MCLCHSAAAPITGLCEPAWLPSCGGKQGSRQGWGGNQITWGKHKISPLPCAELCAQLGLVLQKEPAQPHRSQWLTNLEISFYLPWAHRASNTDISACTCLLSGTVWMGLVHKSTHASQKRNTDAVIHRRGIWGDIHPHGLYHQEKIFSYSSFLPLWPTRIRLFLPFLHSRNL